MELDQLLNLTSVVAGKLLPILGAAALVFLVIFLRKLIAVMVSADDAVKTMKTTLDIANRQLEALDKPMHTLNELSETVDNVHEASKNVLRSVLVALIDNVGSVISAFTGGSDKSEEDEVVDVKETENMRGEQDHESNAK